MPKHIRRILPQRARERRVKKKEEKKKREKAPSSQK